MRVTLSFFVPDVEVEFEKSETPTHEAIAKLGNVEDTVQHGMLYLRRDSLQGEDGRKYCRAKKTARSSCSDIEYLRSALMSLRFQKPRGRRSLGGEVCSREQSICKSLASHFIGQGRASVGSASTDGVMKSEQSFSKAVVASSLSSPNLGGAAWQRRDLSGVATSQEFLTKRWYTLRRPRIQRCSCCAKGDVLFHIVGVNHNVIDVDDHRIPHEGQQ